MALLNVPTRWVVCGLLNLMACFLGVANAADPNASDVSDPTSSNTTANAEADAKSESGQPLTLENLQQQIKLLEMENTAIKRQNREIVDQIQQALKGNSTAQDLVQDLDSEFRNRLKISGYADVEARAEENAKYFKLHHFSLFFKKPIASKWHLFSEIEYENAPLFERGDESTTVTTPGGQADIQQFEHASGTIFLEAMNLDYRWRPGLSARIGRFFTPAGIWSIDHYPPFVVTQERPLHIRNMFPQLIDGLGFYGKLHGKAVTFNYDFYLGNGENNDKLQQDIDGNKSVGLRLSLDLDWLDQLEVGGSLYHDTNVSNLCAGLDENKTAFGLHLKLQWHAFLLQSEYAKNSFDSDLDSCRQRGSYGQFAWKWGKAVLGLRNDVLDLLAQPAERRQSVFINYRLEKDILLKLESHKDKQADTVTKWTIATIAVNLGH